MTTLAFPLLSGVRPRWLGQWAATFSGYALCAWLGTLFMVPEVGVSLLWPAAGVALAATWWWGAGAAVAAALAAAASQLWLGHGAAAALAVGTGVGLAAVAGATGLRRLGFRPALGRLVDVVVMLAAAVLGAAAISSIAGAGVMLLTGTLHWQGFGGLWWTCWVADLLGTLLLLPVLLSTAARADTRQRPGAEFLLLALVTAVSGWVVYSDTLPAGIAMERPLSYVVFPVMIWSAVRMGPARASALLLLHAVIAVGYTAAGHGPFAAGSLQESLFALHAHLAMVSVTTLLLVAVLEERRTTARDLALSEAKYRLVVDNQSDLVLRLDADERIRFASPSVADTFGRSPERLLGMRFGELVGDAPRTRSEADWARLAAGASVGFEACSPTACGERWLAWETRAVRDADGRVTGVVAVGRDVTDRRRAEAESRQYLRELAHAGRIGAMGEMAAGLAHELNQPLCAITTYSQACLRLAPRDLDPDLRSAIERVAANAQRAGDIIRRMRGFMQNGELDTEPVSVNDAVHEVLALVNPELTQSGVDVRLELTEALPTVPAAPIHLHQVLVNLTRNAIEAMRTGPPERRRLTVSTGLSESGMVAVTVADTGPGIPDDLLERLFEPFVTGRRGGLGLGLSISRSIAEKHGGALEAGNRPQGGAWFRLDLPVTAKAAGA
jgi:PAS domain S-box-containing protein